MAVSYYLYPMELSVAKSLIKNGITHSSTSQIWADLGSGDGLFTAALADLLPAHSKIIALDKDQHALKTISIHRLDVELSTVVADLNTLPKTLTSLDGIVMANALHYIPDQSRFLLNVKAAHVKKSGVLILVEYNLEKPNPWVPYPISKKRLLSLAEQSGFDVEVFPNSVKSKLNSSEIYSALLKPKA